MIHVVVVSTVVAAILLRVVLRWRASKARRVTIELGDNPEELRRTKKQYQLRLKELRILNSEVAAAGQMARAVHRSKRLRNPGRGFIGALFRASNARAGAEADVKLARVAVARGDIGTEIAMVQRIINRIDEILLEEEAKSARKKGQRGGRK